MVFEGVKMPCGSGGWVSDAGEEQVCCLLDKVHGSRPQWWTEVGTGEGLECTEWPSHAVI